MAQIVHIDSMCNECGNCGTFCPYDSAPYKDKFTLFANDADMKNSTNEGFIVLDPAGTRFKLRLDGTERDVVAGDPSVPSAIMAIMSAVCQDYPYLIFK